MAGGIIETDPEKLARICENFQNSNRAWVIVCRFPGKAEFWFGTVFVRHGAPLHELDAAANEAIDEVFPFRPTIINYIPGQLVLFAEEAREAA